LADAQKGFANIIKMNKTEGHQNIAFVRFAKGVAIAATIIAAVGAAISWAIGSRTAVD